MARPISFQPSAAVPQGSIEQRLDAAPREHAEALLSVYALLQTLHETKTLEFLRGAFGAGDAIVEQAAEVATSPQSTRALRNLLILTNLLGSIDPDTLERVVRTVTVSVSDAQAAPTPSTLATARRLFSPGARRALGIAAMALAALGAALQQKRNKV